MAEPISSIVTLATVSLAIIKKIAVFIKEAGEVEALIEELKDHLIDLHKWIKSVHSTCRKATGIDGVHDIALQIHDELIKCQTMLEPLEDEVMSLASRRTTSLLHQVVLKFHSDRSKGTIDRAIRTIDRRRANIQSHLLCWNVRMTTDIHRRTSEVRPFQATSIEAGSPPLVESQHGAEVQQVPEAQTPSRLIRTLSEASTAFEFDFEAPTRRTSSATQHSRLSASSGSSFAQSPVERSIRETLNAVPTQKQVETDFHYNVQKCQGSKARSEAIEQALNKSSALATSRDDCGRTPLHLTAQFGDIQLARILLKFSADIDAQDSQPCSVLDMAIQKNQRDFVAFLLDRGAKEAYVSGRNQRRLREMKQAIKLRKSVGG